MQLFCSLLFGFLFIFLLGGLFLIILFVVFLVILLVFLLVVLLFLFFFGQRLGSLSFSSLFSTKLCE